MTRKAAFKLYRFAFRLADDGGGLQADDMLKLFPSEPTLHSASTLQIVRGLLADRAEVTSRELREATCK